jgi:hypothetical protein
MTPCTSPDGDAALQQLRGAGRHHRLRGLARLPGLERGERRPAGTGDLRARDVGPRGGRVEHADVDEQCAAAEGAQLVPEELGLLALRVERGENGDGLRHGIRAGATPAATDFWRRARRAELQVLLDPRATRVWCRPLPDHGSIGAVPAALEWPAILREAQRGKRPRGLRHGALDRQALGGRARPEAVARSCGSA